MTAIEKIVKYLRKRRTAATAPEIAKGANVNYNTVRRIVGQPTKASNFGKFFGTLRKCKVTGKQLTTYKLAV